MIAMSLVTYGFALALVTIVALLFRAALGDRYRLLAAALAPLVCEAILLMIFGKFDNGMDDLARRLLFFYVVLLPGGLFGAITRRR
ncbi:MAG: hypothetical protein JWL96_1532 [Sphingomonas bacterium]|uniref:hypothetical protein n=1 Tax=Sphingomonas bacterium TaxID=1895847 RepID=UPI00260FFD71|nr:hypothetical protein [Sphingomonas bacterium]MDB5709462.1 hypothetical protein [Sphingomonas bacterium]